MAGLYLVPVCRMAAGLVMVVLCTKPQLQSFPEPNVHCIFVPFSTVHTTACTPYNINVVP